MRCAVSLTASPSRTARACEDLDRLAVGDVPHARALVRLADDEPLLLEADERGPHRAP